VTMARVVAAETLDGLDENDPAAMGSRRDLQRVHSVMGTRKIVVRALRNLMRSRRVMASLRILELGAGDGSLMLGIARKLGPTWPKVELTLLDRQILVGIDTIESYTKIGWTVKVKIEDVLGWAESAITQPLDYDIIVTNLFLHHFEGAQLGALLSTIASRTDQFFACEPCRSWFSLAGSHLIGVIGANKVTREDAVLSVHAGFRGNELSLLWQEYETPSSQWKVHEYSAGLFSHCFYADKLKQNDAH
jgi:hypothetical protein